MSLFELFILAVGLSMDAFAVSVCKGLSLRTPSAKSSAAVGAYFGSFQAAMPLAGYYLASLFSEQIGDFDHWIAFLLLCGIGANMIKESRSTESCEWEAPEKALCFKVMLPLAVATSIDALAVGVSFAFLKVSIAPAVAFIGVTTFILSFIGVRIGAVFGEKYKSKATLAGGVILVLIGVKILLSHLGVINF